VRTWTTDAFVDPQRQANRLFEVWKETVEELSPQALLNAARAAAVVVDRQGSRPRVASGLPMHMYTDEQLIAMIEWIQSDGVSRSDTDLKEQLRAALAQKLRSTRTESALDSAVKAYRTRAAESKRAASIAPPQSAAGADESGETGPDSEASLTRTQRRVARQSAARAAAEATGAEAAAAQMPTGAVVDEDAQSTDAPPEAVPADQIIPSYDTDSLRHAELRDAGLREWTQGAKKADDAGDIAGADAGHSAPETSDRESADPEAAGTAPADSGAADAGTADSEAADATAGAATADAVEADDTAQNDAAPDDAASDDTTPDDGDTATESVAAEAEAPGTADGHASHSSRD